ncbi:hypothetical protein FCM35_KLT03141 [Carex littledalei]|uniref:Uncharacterized protein n=1 Tax=Carex littledalei TaxID=544730 RepID=A0A833QSL1_9POAL|nr:hypothetical protein FCM35_KLT03141 [Carex littledalei]
MIKLIEKAKNNASTYEKRSEYLAKRRVAVNPNLKPTTVRPNAKKEKQTQPPVPAKTRPKRAFGVSRNTNIPVEKAQLKQSKPANPAKKNGTSTENAKLKPTERKKQLQQVLLQEHKEKKQEEAMRTPLAVAKKVVEDGTPYLSALNCSKCRLDQLETSSYWLNQIRLSESVGKHFVSATFFCLALECHAQQPFEKIRSELKHYTKRHQMTSTISLFDDLLQSYGLYAEKTKSECTGILIPEPKKEALFSDTHKDEFEEKADDFVCKTENCTLKEEHDCNSNQGNGANERSNSKGKQAAKNEKTEYVSIAKVEGSMEELASLIDSVVT